MNSFVVRSENRTLVVQTWIWEVRYGIVHDVATATAVDVDVVGLGWVFYVLVLDFGSWMMVSDRCRSTGNWKY